MKRSLGTWSSFAALAGALLLFGATNAAARCIVSVGLDEQQLQEVLVQAHRQKVRPSSSWDPDNALFGDDGPIDNLTVAAFPFDIAAGECQKIQFRLIEAIQTAIAKKAIAMRVAGVLTQDALVHDVLVEFGSFEKDIEPPTKRLLVGVGVFCFSPSTAVADLTPWVGDVVNSVGGEQSVQYAAVDPGGRIKC